MARLLSDDMMNCWVAYFAPGTPDDYGSTKSDSFVVMKANWSDVQGQSVSVDGKDYSISHTVFLRDPIVIGGYLVRLDQATSVAESAVLTTNSGLTCPSTGEIISVSFQSDLDNHEDRVYSASF